MPNVNTKYDLVLLDGDMDGKCLDGSSPSIYVKNPQYKTDNKKFVFYFEGGGWCYGHNQESTLKDCLKRSNTRRGSSDKLEESKYMKGIFSADQYDNPYFYDYTIIFVNYCDGAGHQGSRNEPLQYQNKQFWLRGKENTLTALKYAKEQLGMNQAQEVMIAGTSAGGLAALTWADYIENDLKQEKPDIYVYAVSDAGIFLDYSDQKDNNQYKKNLQNILALSNQDTPYINQQCQEAYLDEPWKCMFGQYLLEFIDTKLLVANSGYDTWSIQYIIKRNCFDGLNTQDFDKCSDEDMQHIDRYHDEFVEIISDIQTRKQNISSWVISCPTHNLLTEYQFSLEKWTVPEQSENQLDYVLEQFSQIESQQIIKIDNSIYPENKQCL